MRTQMKARLVAREMLLTGGLAFSSLFLGAILSAPLTAQVADHAPRLWLAVLAGQLWALVLLPLLCGIARFLKPPPRPRVAWLAAVLGGLVLAMLDWTVGLPGLWLDPTAASVRLASILVGGLLGARLLQVTPAPARP